MKPSIFTACPALTPRDVKTAKGAIHTLQRTLAGMQFHDAPLAMQKKVAREIDLLAYLADCMETDAPLRVHYKP